MDKYLKEIINNLEIKENYIDNEGSYIEYVETKELNKIFNYVISKQKIKDKIEENNKIMIDTQNKYTGTYALLDEWRNAKAQNDILEELLKEGEENGRSN